MPPPEERVELVPSLDFGGARRALRLLYRAALLLAAALVGALFIVEVDVVVRAKAVAAPEAETARVESARGGRIEELLVREGAEVAVGQVLVRLDARRAEARAARLRARLAAELRRAELLETLSSSRRALADVEVQIRGADRRSVAAQEEAAAARSVARAHEREARARDEEQTRELVDQGALAKTVLEDAALRAAQARAEAEAASAALRDLAATASRLSLERKRVRGSAEVAALDDAVALADAQAEIAQLKGELAETELEIAELEIRAPRAGVVQGMTVLDPGGVVEAGATIALIVPIEGELIVRAEVPADGIAFVRPGQRARIKMDAYPFQDFGSFPGEVRRVAQDTARAGADPRSRGTYEVTVALLSRAPSGSEAPLPLRAGMTAEVELAVRRESAVRALLRPLRGRVDSVRP